MCELMTALTIGGTVLGAAGQFMNARAQNKQAGQVVKAREQATLQEINRQNALRDQAVAAFDASKVNVMPTNEGADRDAAAAKRVDEYTVATPTIGSAPSALPGSAPAVVGDEITRKLRESSDLAGAEARRRAALTAYDDTGVARGFAQKRTGDEIGMYNNFSRGFASIFPSQLASAENNVYRKGLPMWGDLLGTAGRLATAYGSSRPVGGVRRTDQFGSPF